jgi:hypothetical protein
VGSLWRRRPALFAFQYTVGYLSEGRGWLAVLLERDTGSEPRAARAQALGAAAKLAAHSGGDGAARVYAEEYLRLPAGLKDARSGALAQNAIGIVAMREGRFAEARAHISRAIELARETREFSAAPYTTYLAALAPRPG